MVQGGAMNEVALFCSSKATGRPQGPRPDRQLTLRAHDGLVAHCPVEGGVPHSCCWFVLIVFHHFMKPYLAKPRAIVPGKRAPGRLGNVPPSEGAKRRQALVRI